MRVDGYAPIGDYALIGDGHVLALVARDGSIDWLCLPGPDSPSVFAAILDPERGGSLALAPSVPFESERRYLPDTNVLETTFRTADGILRVTDAATLDDGRLLAWRELARRVECVSGRVPVEWRVEPRFDYGLHAAEWELREEGPVARWEKLLLGVGAWGAGEPAVVGGALAGRAELRSGDRAMLALVATHDKPLSIPERDHIELRLDGTVRAWRARVGDHSYDGPWAEAVTRSALTIALLADPRSGAIIAAPTTSLPERIGGDANYDYRYAWVRDASFTLDALLEIGYREQAHRSLDWLLEAMRHTQPRLQPFYGLDGRPLTGERELDLRGYRDSRPVRVGNEAASQLQLDAYGEVFATISHFLAEGNVLDDATGNTLADIANLVCELWRSEDSGIWELDDRRHYTQSKLACWAALDCAVHLADDGLCPAGHVDRWRREAAEIRAYVAASCWSEDKRSYVRSAGGDELDAACLLLSRREYGDEDPERVAATVDAIRRELTDGPLVFRYTGADRQEGAFVACSFWLVEALARTGRVDEAASLMDELIPLANDVGLYSEQIDPGTREHLGNFPQGLSHLAVATAAIAVRDPGN